MENRKLYYGKILPTISYAVGAWFIHDPTGRPYGNRTRWGLSKSSPAIKLLLQLQLACLLALSGARKKTAGIVLEKEVHVLPILLKLHELATNHRCRTFSSPEHIAMENYRLSLHGLPADQRASAKPSVLQQHPYHKLRTHAREHLKLLRDEQRQRLGFEGFDTVWSCPKKQKKLLKDFTFRHVLQVASEQWDLYQRRRAYEGGIFHTAHKGKFTGHYLSIYNGMSRAESTMAIEMRSGNIGLNANRTYQMAMKDTTEITDPMCPGCRKFRHTTEHLLCHCEALA